MTLQEKIQQFVNTWAPKHVFLRSSFVDELRELMNDYAQAALAHGDIPEVGVEHRHK